MALGARRVAVRLALRVEVALGAHAVARAAVAGLVDVEADLAVGLEPGHRAADAHAVAALHEVDGAFDVVALGRLEDGGRLRAARGEARPHFFRGFAAGQYCDGCGNNQGGSHGEVSSRDAQSTYFLAPLEGAIEMPLFFL